MLFDLIGLYDLKLFCSVILDIDVEKGKYLNFFLFLLDLIKFIY